MLSLNLLLEMYINLDTCWQSSQDFEVFSFWNKSNVNTFTVAVFTTK